MHAEWIFDPRSFVTSRIGPLKNTGSLSYDDLPNVNTFH